MRSLFAAAPASATAADASPIVTLPSLKSVSKELHYSVSDKKARASE